MRPAPPSGLRVVLDTNVYLSALLFPNAPTAAVWELAIDGRYIVVLSPFIVRELMGKLRDKFGYAADDREVIKHRLLRLAAIVQPATVPAVLPADPDDNHILACAVAGRADLLVTGDRDLLRLKHYAGIPIVRAIDLLRTLGEG